MQDFSSSVPGQANAGSDILIEKAVVNDSSEDIKEATGEAPKTSELDKGFSSAVVTSYADGAKDLGVSDLVQAQPSPEPLAITQVSGEQIKFTSGSLNGIDPVDRAEMKGDDGDSSGNELDASTRSPGSRRLTCSPRSDLFDVCERLKEHLYVMSFAEHASQLQLAEELKFETVLEERIRKLAVELSMTSASLEQVKQRNEFLSEDRSQCRSQLQEVICGRDELTKQLHDSKAELEVLSSRVNDLENKLEMSQGNLAALTSELADCKNFAASLQTENESLNGRLKVVKEEKMNFAEEKEYFLREHDKLATESERCKDTLASLHLENVNLSENIVVLRDEKMQFYDEKERLVHENEKLLSDLSDLKEMVEALQAENTNSYNVLKTVEEEKKSLEEVKEYYILENENLAADLIKSSSLVEALQTDISNINGNLASLAEQRNKLREEKENLLNANENLVQELKEAKILMAGELSEFSMAVTGLKQAKLWIERLTEETIFLRINLELHLAITSRSLDITHQDEDSGDMNLIHDNSSLIPASLESNREITLSEKTSSERHAFRPVSGQLQLSDSVDLSELEFWKRNLEEADVVLQGLEKAIDELQSQLVMSNTPNAKAKSPGVSKLIQAFELKSQTDDHEASELFPLDHLKTEDAYMQSRKCTENLKAFLNKLFLHAENTSKLIEGERESRIVAEVKGAELMVGYESLRNDNDHLLGKNIELMVLYEALRQHVCISEARIGELVILSEASQKQASSLNVENSQLREKLSLFLAKVNVFENQLDEICQTSEKMLRSLSNSVETLCKEVGERGTILEGQWNSFVEQIVEAVGKLDAFIENLGSFSSLTGLDSYLEIGAHTAASIDSAIGVIQAQQGHLKDIEKDCEVISNTYAELNKDFNNVQEKKDMAIVLLDKIYRELRKVVVGSHSSGEGHDTGLDNEKLFDPLDSELFDVILQQLGNLADEKMQLQFDNNKLNSDLMDRVEEIDKMNKGCLDTGTILKCFEDVQHAFELDNLKADTDEPLSYLKSLINALIQKHKEICLSMENGLSNEMHCKDLQEELKHLIFLHAQLDIENFVLQDSWKMVKKDLLSLRRELLEKVNELEQSEQRVSSLREKLSIAVTKGKGLVMQRDSLKQSLAETSSQLEIYSQELQLKDGRIHELEAKIKNYSEAGERMEALESELSYIRNSATALRESFLLKDSVLQRIEEILEDLELPEQFHTGGIIEKVDWLAKTVNGNTLPLPEWDQKTAVAAGSYPSDGGFGVMDGWKEEAHPNQNSVDEFRRRYEELQSKFFALAEQNEMLEQSLMERNNLVQRWEDILGRVDMPLQLRSSEPEDRIQWLGTALSEAEEHCDSLQQRINHLDTLCGSLTHNLEESQGRISELESAFQSTVVEKELLLTNLEIVNHQNDEASKKLVQWESRNENFLKEIALLQEDLDIKRVSEERLHHFEVEVRHLQDLIRDVLQNTGVDDLDSGSDGIKNLEWLLKTLIEKYRALFLDNTVNLDAGNVNTRKGVDLTYQEERFRDSRGTEDVNVPTVGKELEDMLGELVYLKGERDRYKEKNQSLVHEIEDFEKKNNELHQLLNQEENKSASLREKLNIAVKKGKSLVQQRDSMKQVIDEVSSEAERLKYNMNLHEAAIAEYEQKIRNLTVEHGRIEATESECGLLRDRLAETEHHLQEKENVLNMMYECLKNIDLDFDFKLGTSVENMEVIKRKCYDLRASFDSSQEESRKSKRAAELLLAELNEVQERNDGLQEELVNVAAELSQITRQKALAEAAKSDVFAQLEKISALRSKEKDQHLAEVTMLQSDKKLLRDDLSVINNMVADVLSKDLKILHDLEASLKSCMEPTGAPRIASLLTDGDPGGIIFPESKNKICADEINSLKEMLCSHYTMLCEEASLLSEVVNGIHRDVASLKQFSRARESDLLHLDTQVKEKDSQLSIMRRNISVLHEACTVSIMEIENWKVQQARNALATEPRGIEYHIYDDEANTWSGETHVLLESSTSEHVFRTLRERLLSVVKDVTNVQNELVEHSQKEMKTVIMNLQKELHEKDMQREKISNEFVNQIKKAQGAAKSYLQDLQSAKAAVDHLRGQITVMEEERTALENRVKELEDCEKTCIDFEQKIASLSDALAGKEQEAEALMQALEEEESQLEEMSNKVGELENCLQQKDKDLENLEVSRGKVLKKLSITVRKFDELHQLSEHLLSEVEKLQSQLQEQDGEISFLRQEVTRCTNEALTVTQMGNKSDEINELLTWLDMMVSRVRVHDVHFNDTELNQVHGHKQILQNQLTSIISELEELRLAVHNADSLLQHERERVEELTRKGEFLENSLHQKESQLILLKRVAESGQATSTASEIVEVEPGINKRAASATVAPQVRGGRKLNSDQVAIAIDMDPSNTIEDEDDDKAHGFKSLTTSRIIPRFTRPATDLIDGLWVSCDRALMRQPVLRLGVIIYWAILHALLATFVV